MKRNRPFRMVPVATVGAAAMVCARWATEARPLTVRSYAVGGIPVAAVAVASLIRRPTARAAPSDDRRHLGAGLVRALPRLVIAAGDGARIGSAPPR